VKQKGSDKIDSKESYDEPMDDFERGFDALGVAPTAKQARIGGRATKGNVEIVDKQVKEQLKTQREADVELLNKLTTEISDGEYSAEDSDFVDQCNDLDLKTVVKAAKGVKDLDAEPEPKTEAMDKSLSFVVLKPPPPKSSKLEGPEILGPKASPIASSAVLATVDGNPTLDLECPEDIGPKASSSASNAGVVKVAGKPPPKSLGGPMPAPELIVVMRAKTFTGMVCPLVVAQAGFSFSIIFHFSIFNSYIRNPIFNFSICVSNSSFYILALSFSITLQLHTQN
jgi:hypothetical protein